MNLYSEVSPYFPNLKRKVHEQGLIYLDSAASTLKHQNVIDAVHNYYQNDTANIHRGIHYLSEVSTSNYESTRDKTKTFLNASKREEIIFTSGATAGINLIANSFGSLLQEGDEIILSQMEHHSNIVPWQLLKERKKIVLKVIPLKENGELDLGEYQKLLSEKTKLVSVVHTSNTLGTVNPIKEMIKLAHDQGAYFLVDAAQAVAHTKIDVQDLDADFLVFSGHKLFGPTGIGILYGKEQILNEMPPFFGGGDMIDTVTFEKTTFNTLPHKFEAGTPNIASGIGLGPAIDFVMELGFEKIQEHEQKLLKSATQKLKAIDGLTIYGEADKKTSVISFNLNNIHAGDIATIIDKKGIAIRTGHHCTQPVLSFYNVPSMARASFSIYNQESDIDALVDSLLSVKKLFGE